MGFGVVMPNSLELRTRRTKGTLGLNVGRHLVIMGQLVANSTHLAEDRQGKNLELISPSPDPQEGLRYLPTPTPCSQLRDPLKYCTLMSWSEMELLPGPDGSTNQENSGRKADDPVLSRTLSHLI